MARVRVYGEVGESFRVSSGVRQGDVLSPLLFLKAVDWVISRSWMASDGVTVGDGFVVSSAEYADDISIIGENVARLQEHVDRIDYRSGCLGLRLNAKKCRLTTSGTADQDLVINGEPVEKADSFCYLGSLIEQNADPEVEVNARIGRAMGVYRSLSKTLWKRRQIPMSVKLRVFDAMVLSVLLYGIELLPLSAACTRKISAFENKCLRGMLGISWEAHIPNAEIMRRCDRTVSMEARLQKMRLQWLGHLARAHPDRLAKRAFFSPIPRGWKRRAGGQAKTWEKLVKEDTEKQTRYYARNLGMNWHQTIENLSQDRVEWRRFIANCGTQMAAVEDH